MPKFAFGFCPTLFATFFFLFPRLPKCFSTLWPLYRSPSLTLSAKPCQKCSLPNSCNSKLEKTIVRAPKSMFRISISCHSLKHHSPHNINYYFLLYDHNYYILYYIYYIIKLLYYYFALFKNT